MGLSSQYKVAARNPALRSLLQAQEGMKRKNNGHRAPTRWYVRQACESHPWHFCVFLRQECPPSPSPPVFSSRSQEKASHASDDSLLPLSVHHYWQEWRGDPGALCTPSWTSRCPHLITHSLTTTLCPVIISALLLPCIYIYISVTTRAPEFQARLHPQDSNSCSTLWTVREHPPHLSLTTLLPCFIFLHSTCHDRKQCLLTCLFLPSRQ